MTRVQPVVALYPGSFDPITKGHEDLRTLFELTKLDTLFTIADSREEALDGL